MHQVLADSAGDGRGEAAVRHPDVVGHQHFLAVRAHGAIEHQVRAGIGELQIIPAAGHRGDELDLHVAGAGRTIHHRIGGHGHGRRGAIAQINGVGQIVRVGNVIDQEIGHGIVAGPVGLDGVDEFVGDNAVDERGARIAKGVGLFEGGRKVEEAALEGGDHFPDADLGLAGIDLAEVGGEGGFDGLTAHQGADDAEVDEQAFLIVDDLGLGGGDGEIIGFAIAAIHDHQAEIEGLGGLDLRGERIVGVDIALLEVMEVQQGIGIDGDLLGQERHLNQAAVLGVLQGAADFVLGGVGGGGRMGGHKGEFGGAAGTAEQRAGAVGGGDSGQYGAGDPKAVVGRILIHILDIQQHLNAREGRSRVAIVHLQSAEEGGPGNHGLLVNVDAHLGANGIRIRGLGQGLRHRRRVLAEDDMVLNLGLAGRVYGGCKGLRGSRGAGREIPALGIPGFPRLGVWGRLRIFRHTDLWHGGQ